jgi:hypothetical protein
MKKEKIYKGHCYNRNEGLKFLVKNGRGANRYK